MMRIGFVFPGQGSQFVGMGKALADQFAVARGVFEEVDDTLNEALSRLIFEGPEADLTLTANAQPALMAVSLAVIRVLETEYDLQWGQDVHFVAGHSLGEYSALAAVGSLTLADTARLLRLRGQAMQEAVPVGEGAMAAIIGLEKDLLENLLHEVVQTTRAVCQIANDNGGGQIVISGAQGAVVQAMEKAKAHGAKRALLLPVSAPFHCALMQPAAEVMAEALHHVSFAPPAIPVVVNVLAEAVTEPAALRAHLVAQVTGSVRWRESMEWMSNQGIRLFYEIGAGKVLSGLMKRIVPLAQTFPLQGVVDLKFFEEGKKGNLLKGD